MNKTTRNEIRALIVQVEAIDDIDELYGAFIGSVEEAWDRFIESTAPLRKQADAIIPDLETLKTEVQQMFDDLGETAQEGPRGEATQEAINALDNAIDMLTAYSDFSFDMPDLSTDLPELESVLSSLQDALDAANE
jgi:ABC-type transporter Mla subunit MlaD